MPMFRVNISSFALDVHVDLLLLLPRPCERSISDKFDIESCRHAPASPSCVVRSLSEWIADARFIFYWHEWSKTNIECIVKKINRSFGPSFQLSLHLSFINFASLFTRAVDVDEREKWKVIKVSRPVQWTRVCVSWKQQNSLYSDCIFFSCSWMLIEYFLFLYQTSLFCWKSIRDVSSTAEHKIDFSRRRRLVSFYLILHKT